MTAYILPYCSRLALCVCTFTCPISCLGICTTSTSISLACLANLDADLSISVLGAAGLVVHGAPVIVGHPSLATLDVGLVVQEEMVIAAVQLVLSTTTTILGVDTPTDTAAGVVNIVVVTTHSMQLHDALPHYR